MYKKVEKLDATYSLAITPRVRSNLSKNNNEIEATIRDTRFVPKVRLTTKVAYVSVEVPTKGRVSPDPKPH
jgi:hypothetical protein